MSHRPLAAAAGSALEDQDPGEITIIMGFKYALLHIADFVDIFLVFYVITDLGFYKLGQTEIKSDSATKQQNANDDIQTFTIEVNNKLS